MIFKNDFIRAFFGDSWRIETTDAQLHYAGGTQAGTVTYYDIIKIARESGIISDIVILSTKNQHVKITDFSQGKANALIKDIEQRIKKSVADALPKHANGLNIISEEITAFLSGDRYIAQSSIHAKLSKFPETIKYISHPYFTNDILASSLQKSLILLTDIMSPESQVVKDRNEAFVQKEIIRFDEFFNNIEKHPLTDEQKRAAIVDEDRNLIIAAAGSGKSSTIVAKAMYLIISGLADAEEILVLTYNKAAQSEIEARLNTVIERLLPDNTHVEARTFHSLGLKLIGKATNNKPRIAKVAAASKTQKAAIFALIINEIASRNVSFVLDWIEYLTSFKRHLPDFQTLNTQNDYNTFLIQMGAQWRSDPIGKKSLRLITIDNKSVKSLEELRIYNWFIINGVEFNYERAYEVNTATSEHGQYYPDFYYPEANLYHEHFALDENGKSPVFMKDYASGVDWKRQCHMEHGTKLIETRSSDFRTMNVLTDLKLKLTEQGITFTPLNGPALDALIKKSFDPKRDTELFATFLSHFKANDITMEELEAKVKSSPDKTRAELFLNLFKAIYAEYQSCLESAGEIDFEDQINQAASHIEGGAVDLPWKYVLVDEFQDISQDRKRLLRAILDKNKTTKLFAVGDDWQAIYRFAGSDIDIMTSFSKHFGFTARNKLTHTFRSYQGLVDVAAKFVQKNPKQLKKKVIAQSNINADQIIIEDYDSEAEHDKIVERLLESLEAKARKKSTQMSVFLLARYNRHLPGDRTYIKDKHKFLEINFMTIHGSKGLEADYVIILHLSSKTYGFPSEITDDPLLHLVIPEPEEFEHAEERRLFYVALTRAKRGAYLLSNNEKGSKFVHELIDQPKVKTSLTKEGVAQQTQSKKQTCPKCTIGTLSIRTDRASRYHPFLGCSLYPNCEHIQRPAPCPKCNLGNVVRRVNGKTKEPFYPCDNMKCNYKFCPPSRK